MLEILEERLKIPGRAGMRLQELLQAVRAADVQNFVGAENPSYSRKGLKYMAHFLKHPTRTILFYPELPRKHSVVDYCALLGYRLTNSISDGFDAVFAFQDDTFSYPVTLPRFDTALAINGRCCDISKENVSAVFERTFGYGIEIDPLTYEGRVVAKSNLNGRHDGRIIECPISAAEIDASLVYQKEIDTRDGDLYLYYRVPVFYPAIPVVSIMYIASQFKGIVRRDLVAPESVFTREEQELIISFADALGMDYGELDILRDRKDGRIYVVDANKTPANTYKGATRCQRRELIRRNGEAFERLLALRTQSDVPAHIE